MSLKENRFNGNLWFFIILFLVLFAGAVSILNNKNKELNGTFANFDREKTFRHSRVYTVFFTDGVFSPTNLQINRGDTVRFKNDSLFPIRVVSDPHPSHKDLPGFDSISEIPSQGIFSYTFTQRGIFGYHNEKKPEENGTIIVK